MQENNQSTYTKKIDELKAQKQKNTVNLEELNKQQTQHQETIEREKALLNGIKSKEEREQIGKNKFSRLQKMTSENIFGDKTIKIPQDRAELEVQLQDMEPEGRNKKERQEWTQKKKQELQAVSEAEFVYRTEYYQSMEGYRTRMENLEKLDQSGELSGNEIIGRFGSFLVDEIKKSKLFDEIPAFSSTKIPSEKASQIIQCWKFMGVLLKKEDISKGEEIAQLKENWDRIHLSAEGTIEDEQMDRNAEAIPEAMFTFVLTDVVNTIGELVNSLPVELLSNKNMSKLHAILTKAQEVSNGVYLSKAYEEKVISWKAEREYRIHEKEQEIIKTRQEIEEKQLKNKEIDQNIEELEKLAAEEAEAEKIARENAANKQKVNTKTETATKINTNFNPADIEKLAEIKLENEKVYSAFLKDSILEKKGFKKAEEKIAIRQSFLLRAGARTEKLTRKEAKSVLMAEFDDLIKDYKELQDEQSGVKNRLDQIKYDMKLVQEKKDEGIKLLEGTAKQNQEIQDNVSLGITPLMAALLEKPVKGKKQTNKVVKPVITKLQLENAQEFVESSFVHASLEEQKILVQLFLANPKYREKLQLGEKSPYYELISALSYAYSEEANTLSSSKEELLVPILIAHADDLLTLKGTDVKKLLQEEDKSCVQKKKTLDSFTKMREDVIQTPVLLEYYEAEELSLRYQMNSFTGLDFEKLVQEKRSRMESLLNATKLICEHNRELSLQIGLLEYYAKEILNEQPFSESLIKNLTQKHDQEFKNYLSNSTDLFRGRSSTDAEQNIYRLFGNANKEGFDAFLHEHLSLEQRNRYDSLNGQQKDLCALILSYPELIGDGYDVPGMEMVQNAKALHDKQVEARKIVQKYEQEDISALDITIHYNRAMLALTVKSLAGQGSIAIDSATFQNAIHFAEICERVKRQEAELSKEPTEEELEEQKQHIKKLRFAATKEGILEAENKEAIRILENLGQEKASKITVETLIQEQAIKDGQEILLAGYLNLKPNEKRLFYNAIARRDVLDISKYNIGLNRLGIEDRDYANKDGRIELSKRYRDLLQGEKFLVNFDQVFHGLLSSQLDDRKVDADKHIYSKRNTAIDWKLFMRALQFVHRTNEEITLFDGEKTIAGVAGDREVLGEFKEDKRFMQKNIHNSGNRFSRHILNRLVGGLKENVDEKVLSAVEILMPKENQERIQSKLEELPIVQITQALEEKKSKIEDELHLDLVENVWTITKDAGKIVGLSLTQKNSKKLSAKDAKLLKGKNTEEVKLQKNALDRNKKLVERGTVETKNALLNEALEATGGIVASVINDTNPILAKFGDAIVENAIDLINFARGYAQDIGNIQSLFAVHESLEASAKKIEELQKKMASDAMQKEDAGSKSETKKDDITNKKEKQPLKAMADRMRNAKGLKQVELFRKLHGYENSTEIAEIAGREICQAILFSASSYNQAQKETKEIAIAVLHLMGLKEYQGDVSGEALEALYEAISSYK